MCVSTQPAVLADTTVGAFEDRTGMRYLAYQNLVQSLVKPRPIPNAMPTRHYTSRSMPAVVSRSGAAVAHQQWSFEEAVVPSPLAALVPAVRTGNAMILPIPDDVANIQVIDTTECEHFLKDIREALTPQSRGASKSFSLDVTRGGPVRIINFDVYTIVVARDAADIETVLNSDAVPEERRPTISAAMIQAYTEWYPGWAIAVCCFSTTEPKVAKPLLFGYRPTKQDDPDMFFIPTLDAHDGGVPDLTADVEVDHTIFVATNDMAASLKHWVDYSDAHGFSEPSSVIERLPRAVAGRQIRRMMRNGDIVIRRADLAAGVFRGLRDLRALPPGATTKVTPVFVS